MREADELREQGYTIIEGYIPAPTVDALTTRCEELWSEARAHAREEATRLLGVGAGSGRSGDLARVGKEVNTSYQLSAISKAKPPGQFSWREKHPEGSKLIADS